MKKSTSIKRWKEMYDDLFDPKKREENRRKHLREKNLLNKRKDTGL